MSEQTLVGRGSRITQRFSEERSAELELGFARSRRLPSRGPAFGLNQRFFEDEDEAPRVLARPRPNGSAVLWPN
jgi:hypothetical protein